MKKNILFFLVTSIIAVSCHSALVTKFDNIQYPPTQNVKIYSDANLIKNDYVEIGIVEAKGGFTVTREQLLEDIIDEAKKHGADAIIKLEFYDRQNYDKHLGSFEKPAAKAVIIKFKKNIN